jgi:hypothetical protein
VPLRAIEGHGSLIVHPQARLTRPSTVDLAEEELLELVVEREHTSTSNTTEDVGASTLEQGSGTLVLDDLASSVEHVLV